MATRYNALITKVRNWANRDSDVINDAIINDCLEYAADDAYRLLRIPILESIHSYTITANDVSDNERTLTIPSDLSSFIQLRRVSENAGGGQIGTSPYVVYTAKEDIRSFYDIGTCKQDYFRWTRQQNQIHVYPDYMEGDVFELYYYRRLPALDSVFIVNAANATGINPTTIGDTNGFITVVMAPADTTMPGDAVCLFYTGTGTNTDPFVYYNEQDEGMTRTTFWATGNEAPNWLKDEHERTLIYGALKYVFSYLQEQDEMSIYDRLFQDEIHKLNSEENLRKYQGGGTVVNFATGGLI